MIRRALGRRPAWLLLLATLLLRALVPAGFMVGTAASGAPALVFCPGVEAPPPAARPTMAMHGRQHHHDPATHREAPCPFAAMAAPALPPAPPLVAQPTAFAPSARAPLSLQGAAAPHLAAPPPPATGPPLSA